MMEKYVQYSKYVGIYTKIMLLCVEDNINRKVRKGLNCVSSCKRQNDYFMFNFLLVDRAFKV